MFFEERINEIVQYLQTHQRATVKELSKKFNVSEVTIRRDLNYIKQNYNIKRTHGGAIYYISETNEFTFDEKFSRNIELKKAIAQKAVQFIKEGDTILLDGGSTNYYIAQLLERFKELKVVTNSIPVVTLLRNSNKDIIFLGGTIRKKSFTTVGPLVIEVLKNFNIDIGFIGTTGIDKNGNLYSPSEIEAYTKKEILKYCNFKIIVADKTKLNVKSFAKFASLSEFDVFITNKEIEQDFHKKIKKSIKNIVLA